MSSSDGEPRAEGGAEMAASNRRQTLLLSALGVLVVVAVWTNRDWLVPGFGGAEIGQSRVSLGDSMDRLGDLPDIMIERPGVDTTYEPGRNLFEFGLSPARIRAIELQDEQRRLAERQRREQQAQAAEQRANQPPPQPPKPPEPRAPEFGYDYVAYLGEMRDKEKRVAVLQRPGGSRREIRKQDVIVVGIGDTIDDQFVIRSVGIDELEIGYTDPRFEEKTKRVRLIQAKPDAGRR